MSYNERELKTLEALKVWHAAYGKGPAAFIDRYADDFVIECPLFGLTLTEKEKFIEGESAVHAMYDKMDLEITWQTVRDDVAIIRYFLWGEKEGQERYEQQMMSFLTFDEDDKCTLDITYCSPPEGVDPSQYV